MPKQKNIPCNNLYKFCKSVEPIMERDKISREEIVSLLSGHSSNKTTFAED